MNNHHYPKFRLPGVAMAALLCISSLACKMTNTTTDVLPRNQSLALFNPHMPDFLCTVEATKVPPIDAQAEAWFLEARAMQAPDRFDDPDYKKIIQLTRLAAERLHWKAMLNLASLYLEKRDPAHGVDDAIKLVEDAMRLGIPAAFDRMGTYYMNGTGVKADTTRAYAFWQKAAQMGNPQAMTFLGDKLRAGTDGAIPGYWANIPVAIKMLACALGQGYGQAAENLHYLYSVPRSAKGTVIGERTPETKALALKVLHEGVRLGCGDCANTLAIEFRSPFDLADMLAPHIDKARGERYRLLSNALSFNPYNRFPNLDMVLPLPPADLPPWNGDRDTLLAAAMGVSLPRTPPKVSAASQSTGRPFLDAAYALRKTAITTREMRAPMAGYWRPTAPGQSDRSRAQLESVAPGLYQQGEMFDRFRIPSGEGLGPLTGVVWEYSLTVRHNHGAIEPQVPDGLARKVSHPNAPMIGVTAPICPTTGIWQPWVPDDHPMHSIVNQYWRQVWLREGQQFPQPQRDWLLALPEHEVTWYLLDTSRANSG